MTHEFENEDPLSLPDIDSGDEEVTDENIEELEHQIYRMTVKALIAGLNDPATRLDSPFLNAALRFLKDNDIRPNAAQAGKDLDEIEAVRASLPFRKEQA